MFDMLFGIFADFVLVEYHITLISHVVTQTYKVKQKLQYLFGITTVLFHPSVQSCITIFF